MLSKTLSVFLVVYFLSDFSHGQGGNRFFRRDYNYIDSFRSFYKIHLEEMSWRDAKQACTLEGASLFYPENSEEAHAVISLWKQYQNNTAPEDTWAYVGISDIINEGDYETIDGKPISEVHNSWNPGQPDNSGDEDCMHLNQKGFLNDITCHTRYSFICKKSLPPVERNTCISQQSTLNGQRAKKFFRNDYNYIEDVQSFYKIHTTQQTWADAKRVCALEGATFWHPENDKEARAVISFWNRTQSHIGWVYVGLSDLMAKGLFETTDGKSVSDVYRTWLPGEPNDDGGLEDCVYIYKEGTLGDWGCDSKYSFICKKSLQSLEWNNDCNMPNLDYTFDNDIGKCYKVHTTPLSWADAYATCRLEQSTLAMVNNQMEVEYLVNLTESTPKPRIKENYQRGIYHMGFHNRLNEGWQTVKGTPMKLETNLWWDNYQPDDRDQCGSMFFNGQLIEIDCDIKSFFICEHEVIHTNLSQELEAK